MSSRSLLFSITGILILLLLVSAALAGCRRPAPEAVVVATQLPLRLPPTSPVTGLSAGGIAAPPTSPVQSPGLAVAPGLSATPTPDPPRSQLEGGYTIHVVEAGDTLGYLAVVYDSSIEELVALNSLEDTDTLFIGQELRVPGNSIAESSSSFKIIPDSELVYGPAARDFDVAVYLERYDSYLADYIEEVEGQSLSGPDIVHLVAHRYSVNPRLLLAALEYRARWVTGSSPTNTTYPMGRALTGAEGLYWQLSWASDQLNWGFYGRSEGGVQLIPLGDGSQVAFAADINDGTAGVQYWLAAGSQTSYSSWAQDVGPDGFFATYQELFGNPFAFAVEPLVPPGLNQPAWRLPWPNGERWYYTGGPHGGWASGSAWAALDFVPPGDQLGCYESNDWVVAVSGGVVTRSDFGAVVVDVDGDGYAGTGWAVTYMHLADRDRIAAGSRVEPGDRLGHPSCEGGFSNGTHVHLSRTYNGRWISADGSIPFELGGWRSEGLRQEYDGLLVRGDEVREACECREDLNAITAGE